MINIQPISFMMKRSIKKKLTEAALLPILLQEGNTDHTSHKKQLEQIKLASQRRPKPSVTSHLPEIPNSLRAFLEKNGGFIDKAGNIILKKL
jgi:hypothetical protein